MIPIPIPSLHQFSDLSLPETAVAGGLVETDAVDTADVPVDDDTPLKIRVLPEVDSAPLEVGVPIINEVKDVKVKDTLFESCSLVRPNPVGRGLGVKPGGYKVIFGPGIGRIVNNGSVAAGSIEVISSSSASTGCKEQRMTNAARSRCWKRIVMVTASGICSRWISANPVTVRGARTSFALNLPVPIILSHKFR